MQEVINSIVEKSPLRKKETLRELLKKCLHESSDTGKVSSSEFPNVVFKQEVFFKGFSSIVNENSKDKSYDLGAQTILTMCEELGIEMEKRNASSSFIFEI